ncbi:MAG: Phosphoglucomutase/phosphomannomutase alpha/beta/alpha domain I [Candidatus Shapirobacteria bacterium GW2011_GWE1_38_10]|uniref:Phosphoglucomutase/phosphomannomutase alpha/beta/alpha domain I n=1 Tax=Candidatus Shapirobacteria bacterium GW2011_GWE1_38_10 TaxID=1618488 RepID=A0A0G0I579_9BACT|nr:MAG: Phosphoglucomutase/phosphomannomutase alpha/beta/alpha domain I [Candidatus Shapirobacteria bacterium GW2011_GWF2_37_20]KKQ49697.1 MAG: Phosphoglucomutase/phosphomannomutase alpha/beta/alpha domain I [Candidatus Shapirobacteria bacterium GW2011_GWE1_38_10]KKQ62996.1 MAG: Phosphoglucomutase/phosphomannomutase alpha/beta/alpha domain I [Candidatus Shapirobacteria bacterium GW2011_GWF1_38_23]HBP50770.1 phosphomannomutase [Candidatus Shapirobacteria bacterium]
MIVNKQIFRGYDIRGIAGTDLTPEIVEHIGKAHGTYLQNKGISQAVVGRDCRLTSKEYSSAFIKGISSVGVKVVDIGLTMVGTFYWSQYFLNIKGGAFITASHNPAEYNGFKLAADFSETLVSDGIQEVLQIIETENYFETDTVGTVENKDITQDYFKDILTRLPNRSKLKILIDPSHTTAGIMAPALFKQAGFEVIEKHCNIDGSFPLGTPDPTESIVAKRLASEVVEAGADIGFTFDADGDRIGIVDEKGGIIWNDVLLSIFAMDVLAHHPSAIIMYNTLCSKVVEDTIQKFGGQPFMWRTGHSFLKKKNQEVKAAFIGELSGHFFFSADFYNHDDGLYSALRIVDFLSRDNKTLSQVVDSLPKYISSPEIKVGCPDDKKVALMPIIAQKLKIDFPNAEIIDDERAGDGVRLNSPDSMFVVRYSQNGPYLTIKFEAQTEKKYIELKLYIKQILKLYPEIDWSAGVNLESLE